MRRYDVASGILLIFSIVDFALAAPVSGKEKLQASVDVPVVEIPKYMMTVLRKRGVGDLGELGEEYFKTWEKPVESSETHMSSTSAPSGPDTGSTNIVQGPRPNAASSTANPDPLMESSSCSSSTLSARGLLARGNCLKALSKWLDDGYMPLDESHSFMHTPPLGMEDESLVYSSEPGHYWPGPPATHTPVSPPIIDYSKPSELADPDFDWNYWINAEDPPPKDPWSHPSPAPPSSARKKVGGQASGYAPGPPPTESSPEHEAVHEPPPSPELTDPENQSSSTGSQPIDLQAVNYALKGKAKESRHISGIAGDVGNPVKRELQPAERSLEVGDLIVRNPGNF